MGMIHLPNMRFYTYNGVFDEEKKLGQQIAVDVTVHYPIETAVKDDDLSTTISYVDVYQRVEAIVTTSQFNLMESLANTLLVALLTQFPQVDKIDVAVRIIFHCLVSMIRLSFKSVAHQLTYRSGLKHDAGLFEYGG